MAGWSDHQRACFLTLLAETGNVSAAARGAGVSRSGAYAQRLADEDFAVAWTEAQAQAVDALELEARRRAVEGVEQPVLYAGKPVHGAGGEPVTIRHYSDRLLELLLKARRVDTGNSNDEVQDDDGVALDDDERVRRIMWLLEQARARQARRAAQGRVGAAVRAAEDGL
ncbi:phage terminase small subunit [Aliidongia dinghuensis]|uniref:Phage terminase small subunit n=1 Tax=Aliidongia dinghuensis TaxID=1867774 RepID=A0A8J3E2M6_9PROT|nr:terminase [Aliidongia dinghuensis]GGF22657.1 phage terminase small subunit [Aliidongia dinghuensis]